jgi:hypothetical protein
MILTNQILYSSVDWTNVPVAVAVLQDTSVATQHLGVGFAVGFLLGFLLLAFRIVGRTPTYFGGRG